MTKDRGVALLERPQDSARADRTPAERAPAADETPLADPRPVEGSARAPAQPGERVTAHAPRRWNDPDEKLMLCWVLGLLLLSLYAAVFVTLAVGLAP